jgi:uncharacterized membrane protein YgcG
VALLLPLGLFAPLRAEGVPARIRDHAHLFLAENIAKATEKLARIHEVYHIEVVIETVTPKEIGEDWVKRLKGAKSPQREFQTLAHVRAHDAGVDEGIFVLILVSDLPRLKPGSAEVIVRSQAVEESFSTRDRGKVHDDLRTRLTKGAYNDALLNAVEEIQDRLGANRPSDKAQKSDSIGWKTIAVMVGSGLVLWLVLALIRMKLAANDAAAAAAAGGENGGGTKDSFLAGLMGGMFGSTAGHWIHDHMLQREAPPAPPVPPPAPPTHVVIHPEDEAAEDKVNSSN